MKQILVIEDDVAHCGMLKYVLEDRGYEVTEAYDGKIGLQLYQQQAFDLIITDIFMPEKEGIEVIINLKKEAGSAKIIAMSGGGYRGMYAGTPGAEIALETAKDLGADRVLYKPIKIDELIEMVQGLLNIH